jgi:hypothetical protein
MRSPFVLECGVFAPLFSPARKKEEKQCENTALQSRREDLSRRGKHETQHGNDDAPTSPFIPALERKQPHPVLAGVVSTRTGRTLTARGHHVLPWFAKKR